MRYETVIGLEVHAQLATQSKLFSESGTAFGEPANTQVDAVCLGLPGVLPVPNGEAVELALRAGLGLGCEIAEVSEWSRKHYFYPDLPKGYQITQFERPYAEGGGLPIEVKGKEKFVQLTRIHMEEDAGKSVHDDIGASGRSLMDYNRAGTPLIEIVTDPDLRSPDEVVAFLKLLRQTLRYIGVCDGNMEQGNFRCDANVSIRPMGEEKLGTRVELKNINSFKFIQSAIEYEVARQSTLLDSGERVIQETRLWDANAKKTKSMRTKEDAHDYRYFPDPDLPLLRLDRDHIEKVRASLPELPHVRRQRYMDMGIPDTDAATLTEEREVADFFETVHQVAGDLKLSVNWVLNEVLRECRDTGISQLKFDARSIGELVKLISDGVISGKIAKELFAELIKTGGSPARWVEERGLAQVSDSSAIEPIIDGLLSEHAGNVAAYRSGKKNILGFFVGQVMKATQGKANPKMVNELLRKKLDG
ncbi:MAG: Asp-tRNA(Asn)/Glu-tRNA(Gln) amidotransferase subunit GatB [Myxococcota bacterium]|nr:Asp-tRNA(Asn)/Glu-tRNA(Gln) amidotransferase subunit GatB [Myxococcota bacterium]